MYKKNVTTQRLEALLVDSGLSQEKFADRCGLSLAALKNYISSEKPRLPNTESLLKICKAFSVSADWLLGLSDVRQPSADLRGVCEYTGLSEESVKMLVIMKNSCRQPLAALDALLLSCLAHDPETGGFSYDAIGGIIASNAEYFRIVNEFEKKLLEDGYGVEDPTARDLARFRVMNSITNLLENGANAGRLCSIYRKNLERLESEQNQKGGLDNGKRTSED